MVNNLEYEIPDLEEEEVHGLNVRYYHVLFL